MKLFEKYFTNNDFTNINIEKMLLELNIEQNLVDQIIIRYTTSNLTKTLIDELKKINVNDNPANIILKFFLAADKMKPITCNKKTLSKLTGLTERMIDDSRRARQLPFVQLSGSFDEKGGRKIIVFDPDDVKKYLDSKKVKALEK